MHKDKDNDNKTRAKVAQLLGAGATVHMAAWLVVTRHHLHA
jgi:hypothetical protein